MSTNSKSPSSIPGLFYMLSGIVLVVMLFNFVDASTHEIVTLEGKVEHKGKPLSGVKVYVHTGTQKTTGSGLQELYYEPTNREGHYQLQFRIKKNAENISLVYEKAGFEPKKVDMREISSMHPTVLDVVDLQLTKVEPYTSPIPFASFTSD